MHPAYMGCVRIFLLFYILQHVYPDVAMLDEVINNA